MKDIPNCPICGKKLELVECGGAEEDKAYWCRNGIGTHLFRSEWGHGEEEARILLLNTPLARLMYLLSEYKKYGSTLLNDKEAEELLKELDK